MNGLRFDLERIGAKCRQVGAKFLVDGTQSVGALEMDVQRFHIDALVCAAYKWLFGPYSLALAYISDDFSNGRPLEQRQCD
jgi:selenocysteine lyase/cysteine desulfurase